MTEAQKRQPDIDLWALSASLEQLSAAELLMVLSPRQLVRALREYERQPNSKKVLK